MKIVHCYKDYYPPIVGGIECHINALAQGTRTRAEVEVLVSNRVFRTERTFVDGIRVTRVADLGRVASAAITPTYPAWLAGVDADILHFHLPNPTADLSYLLTKPKARVVVTYHSDIVRQSGALRFYAPFLRRFLKSAHRIITTSPNYLESSRFLKDVREKCRVIPLGIDASPFEMTPEIETRAGEIRAEHEGPLLLFCGALRYYKGVRYLIEAMDGIDAKLLIIGGGPLLEREVHRVEEKGLADKVTFVGELPHDQIAPYMHAADMLILPSIQRSEAFGLVQLEAHACGKPVVSTALDSGVPFVNEHGRTGLVVPPKDPAALREAINELLASPDRRAEMGQYARERCLSEFSVKLMCDRVMDLYQEVIGR